MLENFMGGSPTLGNLSFEQYKAMQEMYGQEVDYSLKPPEYSDFPTYVHDAIDIYNSLPDTFTGGTTSIYSGKALAAIPALFDLYNVGDRDDRMKIFEVIRFLDNRAREQAVTEARKSAEKANRKK